MRKSILILLIVAVSCQKDFYLSDLQDAEATIERLNNSNSELQSRLTDLSDQISGLTFTNQSLSIENTNQAQLISDLQDQIIQLQSDINNATVSLAEAQELIDELESQISDIRRQQIVEANVIGDGTYGIIGYIYDGEYVENQRESTPAIYEVRSRYVINRGIITSYYSDVEAVNWVGILREWHSYRVVRVWDHNQIVIEWTYNDGENTDTFVVELIEEPFIDISEVQPTEGFWGDEVYSQIDWHDPNSYIEAFIQDAARHGVDLSYVRNQVQISELIWNHFSTGAAYATCRDHVEVRYHKGQWDASSWFDNHNERLQLVWHELGHDILNLDHNYENYDYDTGEGTFEIMGSFQWRGFAGYPDDPYWYHRQFIDMKTRMFEGIGQNYFDCDSRTGKSNKVIK